MIKSCRAGPCAVRAVRGVVVGVLACVIGPAVFAQAPAVPVPQLQSSPAVNAGSPAEAKAAPPDTGGSREDPRTDTGPVPRPQVQTGDEWIYRRSSARLVSVVQQAVVQVTADGISLRAQQPGSPDSSVAVYDRHWGLLASGYNDYRPALAYYSFPLYVGKRWGIDSAVGNFGAGQSGRMKGEGRALGWETVEVPAGKFLAMKVEVTIATADPGDANRRLAVRETHWNARTVLRPVRVISETTVADEAPQVETVELLAYRIE